MQQFIRKAQQNTRNRDAEHDDEQDIHDLYKSDVRIAVVHVMLIDKYVRKQRQAQCADGKHADEQQRPRKIERLAYAVKHDQSGIGDEVYRYFRIIILKQFRMVVRKYIGTLYGEDEDDRPGYCAAQYKRQKFPFYAVCVGL